MSNRDKRVSCGFEYFYEQDTFGLTHTNKIFKNLIKVSYKFQLKIYNIIIKVYSQCAACLLEVQITSINNVNDNIASLSTSLNTNIYPPLTLYMLISAHFQTSKN